MRLIGGPSPLRSRWEAHSLALLAQVSRLRVKTRLKRSPISDAPAAGVKEKESLRPQQLREGAACTGANTIKAAVGYEAPLRGEVKRWKQAVGVGEVSRLVGRLRRSEYAIYVRTSYYTRQAQEEVLEDAYPVKLFADVDLILFFRELRLIVGDHLGQDWLTAVLSSSEATSHRTTH
jgi:Restriction endonuclease